MSELRYKTHEHFFETVGEDYLYPKHYGECLWPVTVEEMYQHFKSRLMAELKSDRQETV